MPPIAHKENRSDPFESSDHSQMWELTDGHLPSTTFKAMLILKDVPAQHTCQLYPTWRVGTTLSLLLNCTNVLALVILALLSASALRRHSEAEGKENVECFWRLLIQATLRITSTWEAVTMRPYQEPLQLLKTEFWNSPSAYPFLTILKPKSPFNDPRGVLLASNEFRTPSKFSIDLLINVYGI